jgi:hypothetical protein
VEFEVETALDKEQEGKPPILFPIRLDNAVIESTTAWTAHIRRTQNIGDSTHWKNHGSFQKAFNRLFLDLKVEAQKRGQEILQLMIVRFNSCNKRIRVVLVRVAMCCIFVSILP